MSSGRESQGVLAREAASVILIRDEANGRQVFVQHRVASMDFAANMVVFPGGRVDPVDSVTLPPGQSYPDAVLAQHAQAWQQTSLGGELAQDSAARVLSAALREVLEESGVVLPPDLLAPWANWITPVDQPKRFDTFFYAAVLPAELEPRHQTTEASKSGWMGIQEILEAHDAGTLRLMPPTLVLLDELADPDVALPPASRVVTPVLTEPGAVEKFYRDRRAARQSHLGQETPD